MQTVFRTPTIAIKIQQINLCVLQVISLKTFCIPEDNIACKIQAKANPAASAIPYALIRHKNTRVKDNFQGSELRFFQ